MALVTASSVQASTLCLSRPQSYAIKLKSNSNGVSSELGFVTSQLSGLKITFNQSLLQPTTISSTIKLPLQPVARRICPFTGKKSNRKNLVSHSNHKTKKLQFVNLQYKKIWWEAGKRFVKLRLSTKALKTIEKNGLDAVAKKAGIDLSKK
ncbi:large ribosomal subunit protein bL28c-like [Rutidosis leptorrhynchoides]|uniref:large ribosomal subunit protein bL28c-like n=1 Tax=Rutidosis leptorrhynchoides TaxID=125765 RepID=UPI003A990887